MIPLDIRRKHSGVPILSGEEIDIIAEQILYDFNPDYVRNPQEIDIDLLAEAYLGMNQDFQYLSNNGCYMGMTVFNDTDRLPIYDPSTGRAEWLHVDANTILIDNRLLEEDKIHQYRFTMGHESSHGIFHPAYFAFLPGQISMFDQLGPEYSEPMIKCRRMVAEGRNRKNYQYWTDMDWMEWQANAGASALLMPKSAVKIVTDDIAEKGYRGMSFAKAAVQEVMEIFNVSYSAALYRLEKLKAFDGIIIVRDGQLHYKDM